MQKPQHHVRHLHARVINIILNFDAPPGMPQQPHERIPQHRIPQMPDVRRLVRIDAVCSTIVFAASSRAPASVACRPSFLASAAKKCSPVKK